MDDSFELTHGQSLQSESNVWYRNYQRLGSGGNAVAYLVMATSGSTKGIPFALKIFRRLSKKERRDSFLKEIEFLKTCDHPSVMRVFDAGVYRNDHPFVVAEYLPRTLRAVIRAESASIVEKVSFALQLLSALAYLARQNPPVIHRDIKPDNIFIKGRSCVLGDFGLLLHEKTVADDEDRKGLKESLGAGMPRNYRTPDLVDYLNGVRLPTSKSDVYQLGLVLAELFTGVNPQRPDDFEAAIVLDPLRPVPGAMARGIANLISRMLNHDFETRDSAEKLLDPWHGVFSDAATRHNALEGRVFV